MIETPVIKFALTNHIELIYDTYSQGRIYYEANEASASGPHHLGGPHHNFNAVSKVDFFIA